MRVVQLIDYFGTDGGLERFVDRFSEQLVSKGHETVVITLNRSPDRVSTNSAYKVLSVDVTQSTIEQLIRSAHPDIVVWHGSTGMIPVVNLLRGKYPTVATVHGAVCPSGSRLFVKNDTICHRKSGVGCLPNWYMRNCGYSLSPVKALAALRVHRNALQAMSNCTRVYAVSQSVKGYLVREGLEQGKIRVFDNTLGVLRNLSNRPLIHTSGKSLRILYVGRLVYLKGVQYLIRAVKQLTDKGEDVFCRIVGEGWYRGELEAQAFDLGLQSRVEFVGKISESYMPQIYKDADLLVVPSLWPEPAGLVVPEARQLGKPIIVSDAGGLPEWSDYFDGVTVVPSANVLKLTEAILNLSKQLDITQARIDNFYCGMPIQTRVDLVTECEGIGMSNMFMD